MANKHRGEVSLQVGSETYTLRLSINELCNIEQAFGGKPIQEILGELENGDNVKLTTLRTIVHAAFKSSHPEMTVEETGNIMGEYGAAETVKKLIEAMTAGMPEAKVADANPKAKK